MMNNKLMQTLAYLAFVSYAADVRSSDLISASDLPAFNTEFWHTNQFELKGGTFSFTIHNLPTDDPGAYVRIDNIGKMTSAWEASYNWFLREAEKSFVSSTDRLIIDCIQSKAHEEKVSFNEAKEAYFTEISDVPLKKYKSDSAEADDKKSEAIVPLKFLSQDFSHMQMYSLPNSRFTVIWSYSAQASVGLSPLELFATPQKLFVYLQNCFSEKVKSLLKNHDQREAEKMTKRIYL